MNANQVLALLARVESSGVEAWLDGGWGVDALVGEQSRTHADVDLVVADDDLPVVRALLLADGFAVIRDWLPAALAFEHPDGLQVDLHRIERTPGGGGDQVQLDGVMRWHYDPPVSGLVGGQEVLCVSLETQLRSHLGYEPGDGDIADMRLLHDRFGCELLPPYDALV